MQKRMPFLLYPTRIKVNSSSYFITEIKTWQRVEKTLEWAAQNGSFASETNEGRGGGGLQEGRGYLLLLLMDGYTRSLYKWT